MKKSKKKGEPFEELSVVKSAGYERGKRRDKTINKRAGLHDKKVEDDETRVSRRKPLAIKHKRRLRKAIPALIAAMAIAMVIIVSGSFTHSGTFEDLEGDYRTVCFETPDDGSSPKDHTVVETIGYLNYTLQKAPYWSSEMEQSLSALFNIKQNTYNYKKYYKNSLISVDIAKGASTSAKQFCQTDKVVLWRDAVDVNDTNGFYTNWSEGKPSGLTINEFKKKRGLPPAEFSVYVLNENTILNAYEEGVVDNGDGTYSVTADLNVNTKYGEENNMHSAVYYYKQQMAVTGGLSQLPTYVYTNVTYTFDENYRVLGFVINDSYEATLRIPGLGEVTSPCSSTTVTKFSYEEADCVNNVYDFFKDYVNSYGAAVDGPAPFTVNPTNCLAGAFASVLSEGAVFKLDLGLGGKTVDGVIAVSLKDGGLDGICAKLGNITAHVLNGSNGYDIYLALGQNKYKLNLGEIALPVATDDGDGDALSDILDALLGGDFEYDSESGLATLNSGISLLGIDVDLNFAFRADEEKEEISLIDVKANIRYGNIAVDATLRFGENKDKPADLTDNAKILYKDILNEGVAVGVDLTLGGKKISGIAKIDLEDGVFAGVRAKLGEITVHYDGENLYVASGESKYKLGLDALGGAAVMPTGLDFDLKTVLSGILENIVIENGIIKTQINGADISPDLSDVIVDISFDLFGGIAADAYLDMFGGIGIKAYLSGEAVPAKLTEQDKEQYTDILNDGITVGVNLTLGKKVINGIAKIDLEDGEFTGVRAKLGEITVHYDGENLYVASGESKYKLSLDALGGAAVMPTGLDFDLKTVLSGILENIVIENGIIKTQINGADISPDLSDVIVDVSLDLFGGIAADAYLDMFGGIGIKAYLSGEAVPAKLTEQDKEQYTDILNDGITVGINLTLDGKVIGGVAKIELSGGEFAGVRAKLGDAEVHYTDDVLYISIGGSKIKLPVSALGGTDVSYGSFNLNGLIEGIINGVHIENGLIKTQLPCAELLPDLSDLTVDISLDIFGSIKADFAFELFGAKIDASATLAVSDGLPEVLTSYEKEKYVDVTESFSISGMLGVTLGGEQIYLAVNNLAVSFENSLSFKLDATLLLNNTYNNFYIEYNESILTVTYGAVHPMPLDGEVQSMPLNGEGVEKDVITVRLDIAGGDIDALKDEIVKVYNRVLAVYNEIAKQNVQAANGLSDILGTLGIAKDGVDGMSELLTKLNVPVKDGKPDTAAILKALALSSTQNGMSVTLGNIFAEIMLNSSGVNCGASIKFGTSSFDLSLSDVTVGKYLGFEVPCESPLDRDGLVNMLDYLGAAADMLLQHNITLDLSGTIYDYDAAYSEYGNIKYTFNAQLQYADGGSMPVTFEDGQLYVSDEMYLHAKLDLVAQNTVEDDSLYLDVYILDGYPNGTNDSGFTNGGYNKDGGLDFFVSVSKLAEGANGYNPLKFYGSMEEVLSIASMGVAMLNLQDINTTSDDVNKAVAYVYNLLNGMLIENYIPTVRSQFESLGASLLPNILKTDLSSLLNKIIEEYRKLMDGIENKVEITEGNFIKMAAYADGRLDCALNSANLFGVPEYEDLTFYITKTEGEHSLISGLGINNIYFGDNGVNKLDLSAGISYGNISKPDGATAFKDYHNFEGLDKLLLTAVNSATHETTDEERAEGYFADYKLNNDYCVDGKITANINLLGLDIVTIPITVNALRINIDENNEVSADATISYKAYSIWILKTYEIITDTATVDISVRKGMIYIRKTKSSGVVEYRIMPASTFSSDTYNQIAYILSFGETVNSIANSFNATEPVYPTFNDYGDYISNFVKVYKYVENGNSYTWNVTVNGKTLGGMAGLDLEDINIIFNGADGILNSLSVSGGLASVVKFSAELNYLNPNEQFIADKSDTSVNVATMTPDGLYYTWSEILGGDNFKEIDNHIGWKAIAGGETGYLSYEGGGTLTFGDYTYLGASYAVGGGYAAGTLSELKANGVDISKAQALWVKVDIDIYIKRGSKVGGGLLSPDYPYTIIANGITVGFVGNEEVIKNMTISGDIYGYIGNDTNHSAHKDGDGQFTSKQTINVDEFNNLSFSSGAVTLVESGLVNKNKTYGHVAVDLAIVCGNGYTFNASGHTYSKF